MPVTIDIKPGSNGVIPVAILTTPDFNANDVDMGTVRFGPTASTALAAPVQYALEDIDKDGDMDMILHFRTQDVGLTTTSTTATLIGKTKAGLDIEGTDSVRITPPKKQPLSSKVN